MRKQTTAIQLEYNYSFICFFVLFNSHFTPYIMPNMKFWMEVDNMLYTLATDNILPNPGKKYLLKQLSEPPYWFSKYR